MSEFSKDYESQKHGESVVSRKTKILRTASSEYRAKLLSQR